MTFDIDVRPLSDEIIFLTDREGGSDGLREDTLQSSRARAGVTAEDVSRAVEHVGDLFQNEISYLVQTPNERGPQGMRLMLEFEIAPDYLPPRTFEASVGVRERQEWSSTLLFHSPALVHLARGLTVLQTEHRPLQAIFNTSEFFYAGSICVLLPLPVSRDLFLHVHDLLFANGLPFPPSAHAQMAAASQLCWRYDANILSSDAFPSSAKPRNSNPSLENAVA